MSRYTTRHSKNTFLRQPGMEETPFAPPRPVTSHHERASSRLLVLFAHKKDEPPFSLLPFEIIHHILSYSFPSPKWIVETCTHPTDSTFTEKGASWAVNGTSYSWVSILNDGYRKAGEACRWVYLVKKTTSANIVLGVSAAPILAGGNCLGLGSPPFNHPLHEWGLYLYGEHPEARHDCIVKHNEMRHDRVKSGDIVKVELDAKGTLSYFLNDKLLGVPFTDVHGDVFGAVTIGTEGQEITILPHPPRGKSTH